MKKLKSPNNSRNHLASYTYLSTVSVWRFFYLHDTEKKLKINTGLIFQWYSRGDISIFFLHFTRPLRKAQNYIWVIAKVVIDE